MDEQQYIIHLSHGRRLVLSLERNEYKLTISNRK